MPFIIIIKRMESKMKKYIYIAMLPLLQLCLSSQQSYAEGGRPEESAKNTCVITYGFKPWGIVKNSVNEIIKQGYYWTPAVGSGNGIGDVDCRNMPDLGFLDNLTGASLDQAIKDLEEQNSKNKEQDNRLDQNEQKDLDQDGRLDGHDKDITEIKDKNKEQDDRLDGHDRDISDIKDKNKEQDDRLEGHDKDIKDINDNAVFYDRDENGKKTGNVTLDAGTGDPVGLGNVADGKDKHDATNVGQLQGALDGLGGGAKVNPDGSITPPTYEVGGKEYDNVASAIDAQNKLGVQYVPDENGKPTNHVILKGDGSGEAVRLSNVADGIAPGDAANVRQVNKAKQEAFAYTDYKVDALREETNRRFDSLSNEVDELRDEARSGIAMSNAFAAMRFDDNPGRGTLAMAMGGFKSTTAMAMGLGYTTDDGVYRFNAGLARSFNGGDMSWNGGMSWSF
ncbi:YadA-like family protein [Bartonella choladocola]|uniref:YadA-like C-terminal region n=1 Tax=Bartonella choladocola TaxID=2750995 RepID=A0A1U9MJE1_9HYPH|nr:YadA-like family protein [Bartonella choladocola]AQT48024.1 YadA-like C-terminal region [Bartonella choladocola]